MGTLFKSTSGKKQIIDLYEQKLAELDINFTYTEVNTTFGKTNVIVTGNPQNPPLILIHGSNGNAPIALETYPNLTKKYRVFAVDVLAQPNKSAETRLSMKNNSYGVWINQIMDELELEEVVLAGFSFGGLIILKTLLENEKKIKAAFLASPAFIVNGNPLISLFKVFIPMKRYMKTKNRKFLEKFLNGLFTERDEFAIKYLSKVFLHFEMDFTPVPTITPKEAKAIKTPITLFASGQDIMFPGKKMIRRANKLFPNLKEVILLENSKHVQNRTDNQIIEASILA